MNRATITLKITISSDTVLPTELHKALSTFGGELTAQIYENLRDDLPELVQSEDFETDWTVKIKALNPTKVTDLNSVSLN